MTLKCLRQFKDGVAIAVLVAPRASKTEIVDITQDRCKMKVKAPPVDGEANEALIAFLAKMFGLTKRQVVLESGSRGKLKTFFLPGIDMENAERVLLKVMDKFKPIKECG